MTDVGVLFGNEVEEHSVDGVGGKVTAKMATFQKVTDKSIKRSHSNYEKCYNCAIIQGLCILDNSQQNTQQKGIKGRWAGIKRPHALQMKSQ